MKKRPALLLMASFLFLSSSPALAAGRGNADDAVAMVRKAVAYLKKNGKDKAYAEFNNPNGQFRDGELYILAFDLDGLGLAHPNPRLVGKRTGDIKDVDGKPIFQAQRKLAVEQGSGWVDDVSGHRILLGG